ncbi:MAG: hypothetical protein WDW21_05010 [Neisseriaceae bacterium]
MKKHLLYILSFLALVACGDMGNAEKKVSNTTRSTHIEKNNAEKESANLSKPTQIEKNEDYFKNPFYRTDKLDKKCFEEADTDFVEMRNCTYDQLPKIEKEILKKAKLLNKENVYTSSWLAKKEEVINKKCMKQFKDQGQSGYFQIAVCLTNGTYALGRSMGNAEKKVGNTTKSTDIEKNNAEKESDNLSEADQIEKNEDFFKPPFYEEDNIDDRCIKKAGDNFLEIGNCLYGQVNRIQAEVLKRAKLLNKENIYSSDWVKKKREALKKECAKEYQASENIERASCLIDGMYALGRSIK